MTSLLRQSIYSCLAGYEDVDEDVCLSVDPVERQVFGNRVVTRSAASTSQVGRFETEVLAHADDLAKMMAMPGGRVDRVHQRRPMNMLILDLDISVSETHGLQESSSYNGHFGCECGHPLFCVNQFATLNKRRGKTATWPAPTTGDRYSCRSTPATAP